MNNLAKFAVVRIFTVLGISWTIIEFSEHFFPKIKPITESWWSFFAIILIGFIAVWNAFRNNVYKISGIDESIGFKYGNLLTQSGNVVVPVNAEFDTIIGNGIVSEKTIHGQFISKYYKRNPENLSEQIQGQLVNVPHVQLDDNRRSNRKRYPIGTCVRCKHNKTTFILLAISEFDHNCIARSNMKFINTALSSLWEWIDKNLEINEVYMPILGSGLSRTKETKSELIKSIVGSSLAAIKSASVFTTFRIIVPFYSVKNIEEHFEFNEYMNYSSKYLSAENPEASQSPSQATTVQEVGL